MKLEIISMFFSYESFAHAVSGAAVSFHLLNNPYACLGCRLIICLKTINSKKDKRKDRIDELALLTVILCFICLILTVAK